jgi:hypothetical protein
LFFGNVENVEEAILQSVKDRLMPPLEDKFELVVASIDGDREQQTWDNVARILFIAENYLAADGKIAILTELDHKPGAPFRWLASNDQDESIEQHLLKSHHPQALPAIEIFRSRSRHRIYLMSSLAREIIEELEVGALDSIDELEHLVSSSKTCLVLSGAQHRWLGQKADLVQA